MKLAYITSSSYSGSTLLSFILNTNPEIATISEFDVMEGIKKDKDFLCSCGDRIRECVFFTKLQSNMINEGIDFKLDEMNLMFYLSDNERINRYLTQKLPLFNSNFLENVRDKLLGSIPAYKKKMDEIYCRNDSFMKNVVDMQGGSIFLDANKNPYRLKLLASKYKSSAIYLYKNGIAGAYSFYKTSKKFDANPMTFKQACTKWFIEQITINRCLNNMPEVNKVDVAYSDLCNDTTGSVNKICNLLEIESYSLKDIQNSEHHIIGNVMRTTGIESIKERLDWKEKLNSQDFDTYRKVYKKYIKNLELVNKNTIENIWYEE